MSSDIQIRRYESSDIDSIYEAVIESQAELSPWMPWCHAAYSKQDTVGWVESRPAAWESNAEWSFVIVDAAGRFLGACGIHGLDLRNSCGELGYWVRTSATRNGIASEATRQLAQWAFREKQLHRIEIIASVENIGSHRVAEKAGATREGILRERLLLNGRWHDGVLLAMIDR